MGRRKIDSFNSLLMEGKNIVLTHCTFSYANEITIEYLSKGDYTLIIDEALDILVDFNKACDDNLKKVDIKMLLQEGIITFDGYGKVERLTDSYPGAKYSNVEYLARNGSLVYLDKTMLVWQFTPQIFQAFKEVYVMTYIFDGSFLKPYFEYHGIPYEKVGIQKKEDGSYIQCEWADDKEERAKYKEI